MGASPAVSACSLTVHDNDVRRFSVRATTGQTPLDRNYFMDVLERAFAKMGARVKFGEVVELRRWGRTQSAPNDLRLDVSHDKRGEYFIISRSPGSPIDLTVLDVQPRDRHLLLLSRNRNEKHRYLLGHDERHWFVAGIPEATPVSRVRDAKDVLKPEPVRLKDQGLRSKDRNRRGNAVRIRQGEWFFVRVSNAVVDAAMILRNEPLLRSRGGKPHVCQELYRFGGETVYVSPSAPNGLSEDRYSALSDQERKRWNWRVMRRDPRVYVRGKVRHPDHKTVVLDGWHEVLSNTEHLSYAMRDIVFLD
jgi:hypothetical protein